jgi:hypothetical protein
VMLARCGGVSRVAPGRRMMASMMPSFKSGGAKDKPQQEEEKKKEPGVVEVKNLVPENLRPFLTPITDYGKKQEKVRGVYQKSLVSPIMMILKAEPQGKITPIQKDLTPVQNAIKFPDVNLKSMAGNTITLPFVGESNAKHVKVNAEPVIVGLCFRDFGFVSF